MEAPFEFDSLVARYKGRRPSIQAAYEQMFEQAQHLVEPRYLERRYSPAEVPTLSACLPGAETIILGLCTIGPALEALVVDLFGEDPVAAVILDELGTLWVNGLARNKHLEIREAAHREGKQASPAYRPGIGRWPMELQSELFNLLPAADIGVRLLDGIIMAPQKSVSMIIAMGTKLGRNCYAPGGKHDLINE